MAIEKLKEIAVRNLNVGGLVKDVIDEILEPALDKMVADSANPYDDMAKVALYPILEEALKAKIDELDAKIKA